jgi:hypothetical protein
MSWVGRMKCHVEHGVNMFNLVVLYFLIGIGSGIWYMIDQRHSESISELVLTVAISILFGGIVITEWLIIYIYRKFAKISPLQDTKNKRKK